jgi:hypothetical protein
MPSSTSPLSNPPNNRGLVCSREIRFFFFLTGDVGEFKKRSKDRPPLLEAERPMAEKDSCKAVETPTS